MNNTVSTADTLCLAAKRFALGKCLRALALGAVVFGASPAFAGDACKMTLCMFGRLTGNSGGGECRRAEQEYFQILVFKKKKKIDWSATAKERLSTMNSCPGADRGKTKDINNKFGKAKG